jgi:hypothetical protein
VANCLPAAHTVLPQCALHTLSLLPLAPAADGAPSDVRLVVPNQPADSYAPVAELEQRAAKVGSTTTSSGPQQQSSSATSSSPPGGEGMAVASTKCTAPNAGSLQVLAGAR